MAGAEDTDYLVGSGDLPGVDYSARRLSIVAIVYRMFCSVGVYRP